MKVKNSVYDPIYISKRDNISLEEANIKIIEYKKSKATSKENFIKKYGEEEGLKKFRLFQNTSKHTEEKYIEKYGHDLGKIKWSEYKNKKSKNTVFNSSYWINKGFSKEEAELKRKEFYEKNLNTSSVDFWIKKGYSSDEAIVKVEQILNKKKVQFCNASKKSLRYFEPLSCFLKQKNIKHFFGFKENKEYYIYNKEKKRLSYYDFTIPDLKIIIEYNGEKFHPNPSKLNSKEWSEWKRFSFSKKEVQLDANAVYLLDKEKKDLAESKGFDYYIIWESFTDEESLEVINKSLLKKGIEYENKINKKIAPTKNPIKPNSL